MSTEAIRQRLEDVGELPLHERPAVFESLHAMVMDELTEMEERVSSGGERGGESEGAAPVGAEGAEPPA